MRKLWIGLMGVLAPAAILIASSGAAHQAATGDTCAATGNGTAYTLNINLASGAPQQSGFAFGAGGVSVTNINIAGTAGTLSTQSLPSGTSAKWTFSSPPAAGALVASLTTSGPVSGSFTVVPSASTGSTLDSFTCTVAARTSLPSSAFSTHGKFTYTAAAHTWHGSVTVSGPGKLAFAQAFARAANGQPLKAKRLVKSFSKAATKRGSVAVMLTPTSQGLADLKTHTSLELNLSVTFTPTGGRPATKLVHLILSR